MKKDTWKQVIQIIVTVLTAVLTTLTTTSCMNTGQTGAPHQGAPIVQRSAVG